MADPEKNLRPADGWREAILPNPFVISADQNLLPGIIPAIDADFDRHSKLESSKAENEQSSQAFLRTLVPDFSGLLPRPIPTIGDYDEPVVSDTSAGKETFPDLRSDDVSSARHEPKLRGIGLIGAVFDVLSKQLGAEYTTAELMLAAQQLIDISKAEYVGVLHKDANERAGYYSWDLVRAFSSHPWQIARVETQLMDHCDVEEFSPESFEAAKFLIEGRGERTWEF